MEAYDIITRLGKGSCGAVFLVRHLDTKKLYALKKIQLDDRRKTRTRDAVLKEARILAKLKHPNIVAYHDSFFDESDECLCIIQDYCDGGTLDEVILEAARKKEYFPEKQIVQWFIQLTMAVQYIHSKKILHRDLKTQNIFLTKKKICKIGDFGISKMMDQTVDLAKTCVGTPCYLAPEMCQDIPYSSKADVWALGCLLYEMCALRPAFDANNLISLFYKIIRGNYEPVPPQYSENLAELVKAILVKNPDERPSARQLLTLPYIREMLGDFIEEKQYQLEQKSQNRDSPSSQIDRCPATKKNKHVGSSLLSNNGSREASRSPVPDRNTAVRSSVNQSETTKRHVVDLSGKALPQKPVGISLTSTQDTLRHGCAVAGVSGADKPVSTDDTVRSDVDAVDYEDDFEEEVDEEANANPDSEDEIPEELSHEEYDTDSTEDSTGIAEEEAVEDDEMNADEYVDDFEEDEEELGELVSHAREVQEFEHTSSDTEDETVIDEMVSSVITTCKQYLQQHCLTTSKKNPMKSGRSKLSDITEEDLSSSWRLKGASGTETEICYLIEEIFGDQKP